MSDDLSPVLALPLIQPAQAQKHVTHNEALRLLDVLVQPAVASRSTATPPASPAPGARFIVPAGALAAWAGQDGSIALAEAGGWAHLAPLPGWQAWVEDEGADALFDGTAWTTPAERAARVARLSGTEAGDDLLSTVDGKAGTLVRVVHPAGSSAGAWRLQPNPASGEQSPENSQLVFHA